jgi:ATP-dependent DNA helicase RecQ
MSESLAQVQALLQKYWGYAQFRAPQAEVIESLLQHQDSLIILPTGAGKSLCFQLPALLQEGLTLVLSPLLALMENQVAELRQRHLPAAAFHSELTPTERRQVLQQLQQQRLRLLYLSPESLLTPAIWEILTQPESVLNGLVLDEAHCLVQWGDTFRPTYRRLGAVRPALLAGKPVGTGLPIAAFTATATPAIQASLRHRLNLQQPKIFRYSPYRRNLNLRVQVVWSDAQRRHQLLRLIRDHDVQTGLIYTRSRQDAETLASWLQAQGWRTAAYHAGLPASTRRQLEQDWLQGRLPFILCTSAFGMGINKSNTRWICHFHPPLTLAEYIQEVGRAGRDGQPAVALTLMSEPSGWLDPSDRQRQQFFLDQLQAQQQQAFDFLPHLPPQGDIRHLSRTYPQIGMTLAQLDRIGRLRWLDPFHYVLLDPEQALPPHKTSAASEAEPFTSESSAAEALWATQQFLRSRGCRWQFLLRNFGFAPGPQGCGHCDNCQR